MDCFALPKAKLAMTGWATFGLPQRFDESPRNDDSVESLEIAFDSTRSAILVSCVRFVGCAGKYARNKACRLLSADFSSSREDYARDELPFFNALISL